jgi:site-specific DNA-methyltransferase (adenine-specific)
VLAAWLDTGHHEVKGAGFMGKAWDSFVPQPAFWREVYRVLKPGGHVAAFFGTRTYDWGAMAIRLAGFEIRTSLSWNFATGFPKGCDIGRAIDLSRGGVGQWNVSEDDIDWLGTPNEHIQQHRASVKDRGTSNPVIYTPADPEAAQWKGWNTQLKPAHEPICLARKPCSEPTVAANVLKWRTGALNIGACRIGTNDKVALGYERMQGNEWNERYGNRGVEYSMPADGRYPATLIHDGSDAVTAEFPETGGALISKPYLVKTDSPNGHLAGLKSRFRDPNYHPNSGGSAARYFTSAPYEPGELDSLVPFLYCAKASTSERNAGLTGEGQSTRHVSGGVNRGGEQTVSRNFHPTCKPIRLMEWLCKLLTPPGGIILDPFMGSGTTGIAAGRNGFDFIGCELDPGYFELCPQRIAHWTHYRPEIPKVSNPIPLGTTNTPTLF